MKIGFLFGAGAEVPYDMPSGGSFALDIFRVNTTQAKNEFKNMRSEIDSTTAYATEWLPQNYESKSIFTFGKPVFESLIKDTVEHNREKIIKIVVDLDKIGLRLVKEYRKAPFCLDVDASIVNILKKDVKNIKLSNQLQFKDAFEEGNKLFQSNYFSAMLMIYKKMDSDPQKKRELGKIITSILQLLLGALGEKVARQINDSPFAKKDDDIDLFDDLGELFQLNYSFAGVIGLNYLFEKDNEDEQLSLDNDIDVIVNFAGKLLEKIFSNVLDYKTLIDTYWHYLYCPNSEWSKFCKISIFLLTVRDYIEKQSKEVDRNKKGYYDDVQEWIDKNNNNEITIATTNYTGLIQEKISNTKIHYLNGSTNLWYDPYVNRIGNKDDLVQEEKHFLVPLLFTQSGTKPMTSIHMSKEYVDVFQSFKQSDVICSVGFGFNPDDEHINGIIRELIEDGKHLVIVAPDHQQDSEEYRDKLANKLKVTKRSNIHIILVNKERYCANGFWLDEVQNITAKFSK